MSSPPKKVAIIGAGLGGLCLALSLHSNGIDCEVYEQRPLSYQHGASIILAANGVCILNTIDPNLVAHLRSVGFSFSSSFFFNEIGEETGRWPFGGKDFGGIQALRVSRHLVLNELYSLCNQRKISIIHEKRFTRIVSRSHGSLVFMFADGSQASASILIGADGLHSDVRQHIFPSRQPEYVTSAIAFSISKSVLRTSLPLPFTVGTKHGALLCIPQDPAGEDILAARQFNIPEPSENAKEGWKAIRDDKDTLVNLLRSNMEDMPDICKSALENIDRSNVQLWPYYNLPSLETWVWPATGSEEQVNDGVTVLLGDSAHVLPPSSAQGANQAFEDAYTLSFLLSRVSKFHSLREVLQFWESWRKNRIVKIRQFAFYVNNNRLPVHEQEKLRAKGQWVDEEDGYGDEFFTWLYSPHLDEEMLLWLDQHGESKNN
ncbi:MAG: hypothetical protein M1821_005933 [Bathelium mastoideum]|nr:MAG: hypothetical protein M1821_005933 [Bathelium mastoideum]